MDFAPNGRHPPPPTGGDEAANGGGANGADEYDDEFVRATSWSGPQPCELCSLWVRLVIHSMCSTMGPCMYELAECVAYPRAKLLTGFRVGATWMGATHWRHDAPPAAVLGDLDLESISADLAQHAGRAPSQGGDDENEHNPYRCAALDDQEAAMADWRNRDAHEFALGASLGFTFLIDACVALEVFVAGVGSLRADSVTLFMFVFTGAFFAMLLVYSLFVAARWMPPAVRCRAVTIVPAAAFRLLALAATLAYATSSSRSALAAALAMGGMQSYVVLAFHTLQALLNFFAAMVVVHRLWLMSIEDERPWVVLHEQKQDPRPSRVHMLGSAGAMV